MNSGGSTHDVPLPVQIIEFAAVKMGQNVALRWKTHNEQMIEEYRLERKVDKKDWEEIAVFTGFNMLTNKYEYIDQHILDSNAICSYRLKIVENDEFTYSDIRTVVNSKNEGKLKIYPNPSNDVLHIVTHFDQSAANSTVKIISVEGKIVYEGKLNGSRNLDIYTAAFENGIYILQLTTDNQVVQSSFSIAH
ncbi:MAG: T9SS type A sorting domain-containing protein [Bacteroidetes bacterium]|nr:T9SS type A sorting domain-containing protein [Bacteroidota bacterium]